MDHDPVLEDFRRYVGTIQQAGADRATVEVAQHVLAVLDAFEARLDALDQRGGAEEVG